MAAAATIRRCGEELHRLYVEVKQTFRERTQSSEHRRAWEHACAALRERFDSLALPGGPAEGMRRLAARDPDAIDLAISFLEADPWFFRSGYIKADVLRLLKRAPLTNAQEIRLRNVVLARVLGPDRREFRAYVRIAPRLVLPQFCRELEALRHSGDAGIRRRADWVLRALGADGHAT